MPALQALLYVVLALLALPTAVVALVSTALGAIAFAKKAFGCLAASAPTSHLRLTPADQTSSTVGHPTHQAFAADSTGPVLSVPTNPPPPQPGPDPGELEYLAGPALRDHWRLVTVAVTPVYRPTLWLQHFKAGRSLLTRVRAWLGRPIDPVWRAPAAGAALGVAVGFLVISALAVVTVLVQLVLLAMIVAAVRLTSATSWLLETGTLAVRDITTECGHCHQRMPRPVFVCQCGGRHRDLMPGTRGTFHRTCLCGRRLPTLLALGKRNLKAHCGHCGEQLAGPVQSLPTFHLPVVGGTAAGKSVLMHTAMSRLHHDRANTLFLPADPATAKRFEQGQQSLRTGPLPPRTSFGQPVAYTVHIGNKHLLHVYDAAGEILERAQNLAVATFLHLSDGIVFVIDPFALPAIRTRADPTTLRDARASDADPKAVLDGLVQTLQEHAIRRPPVAVVITKADALLAVPNLRHPYANGPTDRTTRSATARQWLIDQNHLDVVNSLGHYFSKVRYFTTTYHDTTTITHYPNPTGPPITNDDPAAPILWLLNGAPT